MLVLSRQKNQRINFPGLGISVEILEVRGAKVRVGIDAPLEVRILRDEIEDHGGDAQEPTVIRLPQSLRHDLRNTLHELGLLLHVYRKRQGSDDPGGAETVDTDSMFEAVVERLENLSRHGALSRPTASAKPTASRVERRAQALVVDDNDNERELLAGFLRMCEYNVDTACDGIEAIEYLEQNEPPNVIVLDIQMPRCDGRAMLRKLNAVKAWAPIHVFIVSGNSPGEYGLSPRDGYTRWFNKPLDPRQIVAELERVEQVACPAS